VESLWDKVVKVLAMKSEKHAEDEEQQSHSGDDNKTAQSLQEDEKLEVQSPLGPVNLRRSKELSRAKTWNVGGGRPERKSTQRSVAPTFARTPTAPIIQSNSWKAGPDGRRASKWS
jgi:hypothetical protein